MRHSRARLAYIANPNTCKNCGSPILPKPHQYLVAVKAKRFCDCKCAASYNNRSRIKTDGKANSTGLCKSCGATFEQNMTRGGRRSKSRRCPGCASPDKAWITYAKSTTKGDLFSRSKSWQSARSIIQHSARRLCQSMKLPMACVVCGYDRHVEVSHKKAVSDFPDTATLFAINAPSNLAPLCPTHHWEFDAGIFSLL